jgi:hypothetical protein
MPSARAVPRDPLAAFQVGIQGDQAPMGALQEAFPT